MGSVAAACCGVAAATAIAAGAGVRFTCANFAGNAVQPAAKISNSTADDAAGATDVCAPRDSVVRRCIRYYSISSVIYIKRPSRSTCSTTASLSFS